MDKTTEIRNKLLGESVVKSLKSRHFDAYYANTVDEAVKLALSIIPKTDVVSWGGSMSIRDSGLTRALKEEGYTCLDRDTAAPGEDVARKALTCDTFIMSTNAMTEDGQLVNVDGTGNRVAALIFGPKSVVVFAGVNKICKTLPDAVSRARNIAAPINAQRFDIATPCKTNGMCADCKSPDSICSNIVITRLSKPANKVKVIIVGENLGF